MNSNKDKKKISLNLPIDIIELVDKEAKEILPKLNRTQTLEMIIQYYFDNKIKTFQWKRLCIALLRKILSILDGLMFFTDNWEINSKDKLYKVKEMADKIPFGFEESDINELAEAGIKLRRLLSCSPRTVKLDDIKEIYKKSLYNW